MEPIAITGIGCRFPGASDPQAFWQLLSQGIDAITEIKSDRWNIDEFYDSNPETPGKISSRYGGFLSDVDGFDPDFFGISPKEARLIDPQQRLLLEVAWEALEDGGMVREQIAGSQTGVFIGIGTNDYSRIPGSTYNDQPQGYDLTGNEMNIAAGRLSYLFNLRGPTLAVNTACSSSLVAVHLACQSIWNQEATMALAGGVNVILSPIGNIALSRLKALSPDGRCKTFDASANGYVRSEGAGCILLKPLSQAIADKDSIYAVIRGSAINHDGRSKGLTVPYGPAQEALIRRALKKAEVAAKDINYVELHGTGTPLGDPIEAMALGAVLQEGRNPDAPCLVGAVKSNIGHLEAAAGIASVIKMALSLKHQQIPPSLHFNQPNPYIPFDKLPLKVQSSLIPWPQRETSAKVGISSFGFSGTNAHVILEGASVPEKTGNNTSNFPHLLPISAHTPEAVITLAQQYQGLVAEKELTPNYVENLCYSASVRRSHHTHRRAVLVDAPETLRDSLQELATLDLESLPKPSKRKPKVAFVFSGQGPQWWAMGRELLAQEAVFRAVIEECDSLIQKYAQWSLLEQFTVPECESRLQETEVAQPALLALQVGLAQLWRSWGIEPKAVVGHSLGEVAAAHFAGVLTLEEAVCLICHRSQLMQQATGNGKMLAVELQAAEVQLLLESWSGQLEIAAINSPSSTVVSGKSDAIDGLVAELQEKDSDIFYKELPVNYAFHSQQMEPFAEALVEKLGDLNPQKEKISIFSTVTGNKLEGTALTAEYWGKNMRQTVRFTPAIEALIKSRHTLFLEVSPHPVLSGYIKKTLINKQTDGVVLPSLRRKASERKTLLNSLGTLYTWGQSINWQQLYPDICAKVELPLYPWQRDSYWIDDIKPQFKDKEKQVKSTSSLLQLLVEGNLGKLTEELNQNQQLSAEGKQVLPQILSLLVDQEVNNQAVQGLAKACYQVEWQESPLAVNQSENKQENWLIFGDKKGVGHDLANVLNHDYSLVISGDSYQALDKQHYQINPHRCEDFEQLLNHLSQPITKIVYCWGLDSAMDSKQSHESLLFLLQTLLNNPTTIIPKLWIITQQAQPVLNHQENLNLAQTLLWGMGQVIALEHPQLWGGLIDLDGHYSSLNPIIAQITTETEENRLAFRGNKGYLARLVPKEISADKALSLNNEGCYLITGGLGALGLTLADWLVEKGARHLILTSRRSLAEQAAEKQAKIAAIEGKQVKVTVIAADVANYAQMQQLFEQIKQEYSPLRGIIHAAGVLNDKIIEDMDRDSFQAVLKPKVRGGWNLHKLSQEYPLDFFVCFSSMSALLGSRGQLHYAGGNAFLDGLVQYRRRLGLPGTTINWGPWAEGGMATQGYETGLKMMGIKPLEPIAALNLMGSLLSGNAEQTMVAEIDWGKFSNIAAAKGKIPFLAELLPENTPESPENSRNLSQELENTPPHRRIGLLTQALQEQVAQVLGRRGSSLPETDQGFFDMGMDSLMSVELKHRLEKLLKVSLPSTLAFEYPTIDDVVTYVSEEVFAWKVESNSSPDTTAEHTLDLEETLTELEGLSQAQTEALMEQELAELEALLS
ncbi:type I polyketide synthase [Crocosphaera sp.]|uniref:type I polyketide synthase n=1 Tax=Crocosphaera sp. TaxID=2729996 RepID=UPI003F274248|nr:type I polyketide synthase [Crocosphaera sp.]